MAQAPAAKPALHEFVLEHHHPVIQVLSHITSPLTGTLLIFGVHKFGQLSAARAAARATLIRHGAGRVGAVAAAVVGLSGALAVSMLSEQRGLHAADDAARGPAAAAVGATAPPRSSGASSIGASSAAPRASSAEPLAGDDDDGLSAKLAALYGPSTAPLVARHVSAWYTSALLVRALRVVHEGGLPWWGTIAAATVGLRVLLVPLNLYLLRNTLRLKVILPEVERIGAVLAEGGALAAPARAAAAAELAALFARARCSPWQGVVVFPLLLPPLVLSFFGAIHTIAMTEPACASEGLLWSPDLLRPDSTQLLPILSALSWLVQVETGAGASYAALPTVRLCARMTALAFIPLTATLPSGVFVFWITSNVFAIARGRLARLDAVRRAFDIPLARDVARLPHLPKPAALW